MPKFRKRPVVVEAFQWNGQFTKEIIQYTDSPDAKCKHCILLLSLHGWIDTFEGGHIACPEDYIITGVKGEKYPCKPDIFELTYEPVDS